MKLKFCILLLLSILSVNLFAATGHGYRILSVHREVTPGLTGGVVELDSKGKFGFANARTLTSDKTGKVMDYITIDAYHDIFITNYTQKKQVYAFTVEVNCDSGRFRETKHVEILPQGTFTSSARSFLNVRESKPVTYRINAMTQITGESNAFHEAHAVFRIIPR